MTQKTWFITGASSGFGAAFATYALSEGHNVVATARRMEKLKALADIAPDRVLPIALDVNDHAAVGNAIAKAEAQFGGIDVLINNAGFGTVGAVEEFPMEELRAQMETNFFAAAAVTQAALPGMRARGTGAIVMISSLGGQLSMPGFGPYSASKFALEGLTEALAAEIAPLGLKAMIVEPGAFRTEFATDALRRMPQIDAYAETVGPIRAFADGMDGTQAGDPAKAARAIDLALQADDTPLRLQLGHDAVDTVREHSEALLAEMAKWEATARSVSFEDAA
ncbi:MAG: oxidoreductase [Pseudomonadota bacterium]